MPLPIRIDHIKKGTPFKISSHQWMRKEFEKDLMFLWDECAWKYQNGTGKKNWDDYPVIFKATETLERLSKI